MNNIKYILFMSILEVILVNHISLANFNYPFCKNTINCTCADETGIESNTIVLRCPSQVSNLKISFKPSSFIDLECKDNTDLLMPSIKIGKVRELRITNCTIISNNKTFLYDLINNLGIETNKININNFKNIMTPTHLQGLPDINHLKLQCNNFTDLSNKFFEEMNNLQYLDIKSNTIEKPISESLFRNLRNLSRISFGANQNQTIPPNLFKYQTNLKQLDLYACNIKTLSKEILGNNIFLKVLTLASNNIEIIEPHVFDDLSFISYINLKFNKIQSLPENLLAFNKNLTIFLMVNIANEIRKLPSGFFANLTKLTIVEMSVKLSELPENCFEGSKSLTSLSLARNKLTSLPMNIFIDQINLTELNLDNNSFSLLNRDVFRNIKKLTTLILSNNQLTYISSEVFSDLINLKKLILNNNKLVKIHQNAFKNNLQLIEINFSNNQLKFIGSDYNIDLLYSSSALYNAKKLIRVNLSYNSLTQIAFDWRQLEKLRSLDLRYNNFTEIEYANIDFKSKFNPLVNLTYNKIRSINFEGDIDSASSSSSMTTIDIDNNQLNCDCTLLHFVKYIQDDRKDYVNKLINIEKLKCTSPEILKNTSIEKVEVMKLLCPLDSKLARNYSPCTYWNRSADKSTIVNCTGFELANVPIPMSSFNIFENIELHIDNNNITQLPDTFQYATNINRIYAQNNQINTLTIENLPYDLETLVLTSNQLNRLNKSLLTHLSNMTNLNNISLGDNPWLCDCEASDFVEFISAKVAIIDDVNEIRCKNDNNQSLIRLNREQLCKEPEISASDLIIMTSVIACIICLIISMICYIYRKEIAIIMSPIIKYYRKEDEEKLFDAFISFAHQDENFILEHLRPKLEDEYGFKLNLHFRDWIPGVYISDQIVKSVMESKRTLVILSSHFIESIWGQMEFRVAHHNAIKEGQGRVIIIIYGDIENTENIDSDLKAYLKMNTYIKWGDPWFWKRLVHALPSQKKIEKKKKSYLEQNKLQENANDKYGLMKPELIPPLTTPPADTANKNPLLEKLKNEFVTLENGSLIINTNNIYKM